MIRSRLRLFSRDHSGYVAIDRRRESIGERVMLMNVLAKSPRLIWIATALVVLLLAPGCQVVAQ